ncbi:MAG: FAD-dependent monooxygenase [Rickettsiales bacterium]
MNSLRIAVVGGGIAGLTAVIALCRNGHEVDLFEAAPQWGDVGAGITLAPNAMRGLDAVGVGPEITAAGVEPTTQTIGHWHTGKILMTVDRRDTSERYGAGYVYIHRADLHAILVAAAEAAGARIHLAKSLINVDISGDKPQLQFADGSSADADLVVGADGLKSQVRKQFDPAPPHFTGHIAYRALAQPTPEIQALIDQPGMHIGPGKQVVRYPLRKGKLLNLVFFARQDGWAEDGWSIPADSAELTELFADWCLDVRRLVQAVKPGTVFKWAINAHQPLSHWSLNNNLTLIGDAAHAMTPFLGQGAATGIEDAVILARAIDDSSSLKEALSRYESARFDRTTFIQLESNENADRLQGEETELYGLVNLRNEETLGLFAYDCVNEPV